MEAHKKRVWSRAILIAVIALLFLGYGTYRYTYAATESAARAKMSLNDVSGMTAPNFTLTDQHGHTLSLHSLKGKVVIIEFMDPQCTDICPIVSQEIVNANGKLGSGSSGVVYLGVNVNQYHESIRDIQQFSNAHGLSKLSNWYFLTGNTDQLKAVWKAYGISVVPNPTGDVEHSSFMYFIDAKGQVRYIANPDNSKASIDEWSNGIALFTSKLL